MPTILAIDTTTNACSCALTLENGVVEHFDVIPRQHASRLLPMIDRLMADNNLEYNDLDAVAFGQGPGSFTGLRIAAGVAQGIAFGSGLPVIPVSSLASLALQADAGDAMIFATLDARIDEIYWGFYRLDGTGVEPVGEEGLCKPESLPPTLPAGAGKLAGVGSGLAFVDRMPAAYRDGISDSRADCYPRASTIATLALAGFEAGHLVAPEDVSPVYLRDKVTHDR